MEVNLVIGDPKKPKLNASGVVVAGGPFIAVGYSDEIGWTHTNNTIQNTNLYELTLTPDGTSYNFGSGILPLKCSPDTIRSWMPTPKPSKFVPRSTDRSSRQAPNSPIRRSPFASPASTSPPPSRSIGG
jgi:hypothetical protein